MLTQGRRVSGLAQHMVSVLSDDAAAGWGAEYRIVLRDHLLPFAEYARQIFAEDAWGAMCCYIAHTPTPAQPQP